MSDAVGVAPPIPVAPGVQKYQSLIQGGFTVGEANQWRDQQTAKLAAGGFKPSEIDAYWGSSTPQSQAISDHVANNMNFNAQANAKVATNASEAFAAGWDISVAGLLHKGHAPDMVLPENASLWQRVAHGTGQFIGDAPTAIAGFIGGGAAGAAVPGAGETGISEVAGAGFGAAALPEASRQVLLDSYAAHDGKIKTWQDAIQVAGHSTWETAKAGMTGMVSNFVGGKAGEVALKAGASELVSGGINVSANAAAASGMGGALNGHVPDAQDFEAGAIIALAFHTGGAVHAATKGRVMSNLQQLYRQTGIPPWQAADRAAKDPVFNQEIMSQDVNGDVVAPNFRSVAPGDPPPYAAHVSGSGLMEDRQAMWRGDTDMKNITPPKPTVTQTPSGVDRTVPAIRPPPTIVATDAVHAKALLAQLEGSGDNAVSPKGAIGKYQIMPATARQYMGNDFDVTTLHDPAVNSAVADRIVADLHKRFNGDMTLIATAYNAGPGRAGQLAKAGPGSALVATPDKNVRGGIRYDAVPSRRDESFLPLETQHYLANERRRMGSTASQEPAGTGGGAAPPSGGGGEKPAPEPEWPHYEVATLEGGGGGGGEPPKGGKGTGFNDDDAKRWKVASDQELRDEMLSNIGEQPGRPSVFNLDRIMGQFVSELTPARRIDDLLVKSGEMDRNKDMGAEDMFRQTYASDARAGAFVRYGVVDPITMDIKPESASILQAVRQLKKAGGDMDGWKAYMLALRTRDKADQGIDTGFQPLAARELASRASQEKIYGEATATFNQVMDGALDYSRDSGIHSDAQIEAMKRDNPAYISMRRVLGDDEAFTQAAGRGFGASDALKRMEGSDRQIIDPIAATIDNIRVMIKMADRNRAIGHIVGMAERGELGDNPGILKIEDSQTIANPGEASFKPYGLPPEAVEGYTPLAAQKDANARNGPNDFTYFRNGQAERWTATDPALAELMRKADTPGQANFVMKTFQTFAGMERSGIVISPDFPTKVQLRHQVTAFIMDPLHPLPFVTWLRGIGHVIGQDDVFQDAVAKGAFGVALADMDTHWLSRDMDAVFTETSTWDGMINAVQHPLQLAQLVSERLDAAARIGYTLAAKDKGIDPVKAATMSRKAYLDYAEKATAGITNSMASIVPFFRPHILGMKQFGEAVAARPVSTALYGVAAVALPAVALYAANFLQDQFLPDGQKYADLPRWVKDNYFVTPSIAGVRFHLRTPPNIGYVMSGMVNRLLDYAVEQDKHAFEDWAKGFLSEYVPPIMPALVQPPAEVITNHNFYTGQSLIPDSLAKNSGYMQYTAATSETGKALSRALGPPGLDVMHFSPIQFDQFVKGWTGSVGATALHALDMPFAAGKKPWEIADTPFLGSFFVRNPGMNAASIQQFYKQMDDLEAKQADFAVAMKHAEQGQAGELDQTAPASQYANAIAPIKQAIQVQATVIQGINQNKDMTAKEKRQAIDGLMPQVIETAKMGIKAMDDLHGDSTDQGAGVGVAAPPPMSSLNMPAAPAKPALPAALPGANRGLNPSD